MINPQQIIQMILGTGNPMQMIQNMAAQNPMMKQALNMVQNNNPNNIEQVARNLCQQKGIDFNQFMNQMQQMGLRIPHK